METFQVTEECYREGRMEPSATEKVEWSQLGNDTG